MADAAGMQATDAQSADSRVTDERTAAPDPLLVWCLAAFHTGLFVLVPVTLLHWAGALGDLLGGLSTVVGLVLYLLLWATTWRTNRRLLAATPFSVAAWRPVLKGSVWWGGVTGSLFFAELAVVAVGQVALAGDLWVPDLASVPVIAVFFTLGTLAAFVVGALVGVVQAALDLLALRVVGLLR